MGGFSHLVIAMALPAVGYFGVKNESARLIWVFHLGNVQFAVFHLTVGLLLLRLVLVVETAKPEVVCARFNPEVPVAMGARMTPAQEVQHASDTELFNACIREVAARQGQAPAKIFWWSILTAPLWICMIYAALQAHEYYVRLRVRELKVRTGFGEAIVVAEEDPLASDDVE